MRWPWQEKFPALEPREVMEGYMLAWQKKDWKAMERFTTKTWRKVTRKAWNVPDRLRTMLGGVNVKRFEIMRVTKHPDMNPEVVQDVIVKVQARGPGRTGKSEQWWFRLIKERKAFKPSAEQGTWGVNPASRRPLNRRSK